MTIEVVASPSEAERDAILRVLIAYNEAAVGPTERQQVAIVVRDDAEGITGGLWGKIGYRWLFVEFLAIAPEHKGQGIGRDLMQRAEAMAREAGCIGIWLDTFSF
ncbi:MAG: GNAT family N-acetyltransferase [Sphingomonas paucimobilis]